MKQIEKNLIQKQNDRFKNVKELNKSYVEL